MLVSDAPTLAKNLEKEETHGAGEREREGSEVSASSFIFFLVRITKSVKETQGLVGGAEALQAGIHEHSGTQVHSLGMGIWSLAFPF